MKVLFFALFFVGAHALVLPPGQQDPRCRDPTYACQDLRSARDCGIVKECINDYWSTLGTPKVTNEVCDICKQMVQEARDQLLSNMTQEELKEVFEGSCKFLPTKTLRNLCIKLVDEFIPELVEMLASRMDPTQVCTVCGLCTGEKIFLKQTCNKCIDVSVGVKKMFNLIPKELFRTIMVQECQSKYESQKDECQNLFGTDWDKVHEYITNLTPEVTCSQLSLCEGEHQKIFKDVGDNMTCEFCENLAHYLQNLLESKSLKEEIRTAMNNMCKSFGNFRNECQSLIAEYYDKAYDMLINELDPIKVCTALGLCDQESNRSEPIYDQLPEEQNDVKPTPKDDLECIVCKKVMNYVKVTVTKPENEEEVRKALDKVCTILPSSMTVKCQEFVNAYTDLVIYLLAEKIQPEEICKSIGLCPKQDLKENANSIECYLCKKVITELKSMITERKNEDEIRQALDTVCECLPNRYSGKCVDMVNTYSDMIISLLVRQLEPNAICRILNLCSSQIEIHPENLNPADECELCQMAVDEMEILLQNNQIDNDITKIAEKVCNILPQHYASRCQTLIETYGPYVLQMFAQLSDSQQICAGMDLCPSSLVEKSQCKWGPSYWCSSPENAKKCGTMKHCQEKYWDKKERLLGSKKCTWGPSYWCTSPENAKACNAEAHCRKIKMTE